MLNNWLFLGLTVVVFWGSWAEAITTILVDLGLRDTIINLGPDYYTSVTPWFLVGIYILMGVTPLAAWRRSTAQRLGRALAVPTMLTAILVSWLAVNGTANVWALFGYGLVIFAGLATLTEIWKGMAARHRRGENYWVAFSSLIRRDRHRYGGFFIHLGMVVLGIGVVGSTALQDSTMQTLGVGEQMQLGDYTLQHNGLYEAQAEDGRTMIIGRVSVFKNSKWVANIEPRRDIFMTANPATGRLEPSTNLSIPGMYSTLAADFYAIINYWEGNRATYRAYLNPLISFVWIGGLSLIVGTVVALWPTRQPKRVPHRVTAPSGMRGARASGGD